ncbi:MAG: cation-translocating P-type ATPase [Caldilineaceae bacterium]
MTPQENPPSVAPPAAASQGYGAETGPDIVRDDESADPVRSTWHAMGVDDVVVHLASHDQLGLTGEEAARRLVQYGRNELQERPRPSFWELVLAQLNNFVIILLIVAAVISALLGDWVEAGAILLIVVLNAVLGVVQESRAEQALAALKKMASPEARVLRDGVHRAVPASELVPGDLVLLEAGNFVPADLRLLEAVNLRIEEAALTGESEAVEKSAALVLDADATLGDRKNTAFMGTTVAYGRGRGLVVATGMRTQLGLIADMLQNVEQEETPLQQRLDELGRVLGWGALAICAIVFLVGIVRSGLFTQPFTAATTDALVESFMIAVSLAIAAVPEGLPAVVTISLALGMREMVRRHALIRKLASVETLGSATVICSDKTGTLTQNVMTVTRMWVDGRFVDLPPAPEPGEEFTIQGAGVSLRSYPGVSTALWVGVLNNDAQLERIDSSGEAVDMPYASNLPASAVPVGYRVVGDPTEGCILLAAARAGVLQNALNQAYPRQQEVPFDSTRKRMVTVHDIHAPDPTDSSPLHDDLHHSWSAVAVKGAPDVVLRLCTRIQTMDDQVRLLDDRMRQEILGANDSMTKDALRVLGLAYRLTPAAPDEVEPVELEQDLIFAGLIGMMDPARTEVKPALATARNAGIRTIMITGDYPNTARAIAEGIGLLRPGHAVMTGAELNALDDAGLAARVETTDVFARVSPEHKLRIVDALRANDEVVAMTGDGVNDAPAIKRADIGVAMGITGTDVAKETADMVLTDDNYASIVAAIEQGRVIYANIRKFVFFLLSSNVAEIMIIFLATLAALPTPLTAIQLLWLNLLTDGAPALALAMEKGDPDIMAQKPRPKNESIVNRPMRIGIVVQTIAQTTAVLGAFLVGLTWHLDAQIPPGANPFFYLLEHNWRGVDVRTAQTMAFVTLSMCELFRAYTVRSERVSVFRLGIFSNKYMQYAVGASIVLLLLVIYVPFLQPVFNTHMMSATEWSFVLGLSLIPAAAEEITKFFLRRQPRGVASA